MEFHHELRRLAKLRAQRRAEASTADPAAVRRATLRCWKEQLSVALQKGTADALLTCIGQDQESAIVPSFPEDTIPEMVIAWGGG